MPAAELVICSYCDTVHQRSELVGRKTARCVTCDGRLYRGNSDLGAMLAVALTAAIAFGVANALPLLTLHSGDTQSHATLWQSIVVAYDHQMPLVATALALTLLIAPALEIGLLLWVLVPLCSNALPPAFATSMWLMRVLRPWRMVEVFLLGAVVAIVKLSALSSATPEWGLFGIAVMTFAFASLASFDLATLWRRAEELAQ